ncbi:MAG: Ig-like domain-containing protein [Isosphaeraceae bacterium]
MDPARRSRLRRIALEPLESRTLLAVLPAPLVSGQATISGPGGNGSRGDESNPSIAIDRYNPLKQVVVWTRDDPLIGGDTTTIVEGKYSNDGGQTWSGLGSLGGAMRDPTTPSTAPKNFAQITDASVAFGPGDSVYVLTSQHSTSNATGALVLNTYDFSGTAPVASPRTVVREWIQDPVFTPMLAVDDNLPSYSDTDASGLVRTQTDPYSGTVYIAWASQDAAPALVPTNFNPNSIQIIASANGGQTFTTSRILNDGGHAGTARNATPRLAISQGGQGVSGGQVTVVWDDFGTFSTASPPFDAIMSDRIQDGGVGHVFPGTSGGITDNGSSDFTASVTLPANSKITDLNVTVNLDHADLGELTLTLIAPDGRQITLIANQAAGANMGTTASGFRLGTVFDSAAARNIADFNGTTRGAAAPFTGHFRPQGGNLGSFNTNDGSSLNGPWILRINDNKASNVGTLVNWSLNFTEGLTDGSDVRVSTTATYLRGSLDSPFPLQPTVSPDRGIGPAPVIASDNTLGAFSPYQGRLYVAYTGRANITGNPADNTDIYLSYSDNGGLTWSRAAQLNDDVATRDGFSEASFSSGRPQFQPELAVDQTTGTLVASFLDARYDAARARVVTTITASIDGGVTFSPQVYANANRTATDAATGQTVNLGPVPENQSSGNSLRETSFGFGDHQGLAVAGGKIYPVWAGNHDGGSDGKSLLDILTASVAIAAGPRIINSTMGPVGLPGDTVNGTRTADGSPQASAFELTFDRPVAPGSFNASAVRVFFTDTRPGNPTGGQVPVFSVVPLDLGPFGATRFRVNFAPSSAAGTYSYTVSPSISDRIRTIGSTGNIMDQNGNASTGEGLADLYAVPRPVFGAGPGGMLSGPFDQDTLPLIVPGPHLARTFVPGAPASSDNLVLDGTVSFLDVTFDRPMQPGSFTPDDVLRIIGPYGEVPRFAPGAPGVDLYTVTPDPQTGEDPSFPKTFRIGFPTQQLSGTYVVTIKPSILSKAGDAVDTNLNAGVDLLTGKATAGQTTPISYNSTDTPLAIPDVNSISSQITITDNFVIQGVSLRLNITHPNDPDLQAYLIAPDGTQIKLFTHIGGTGTRANFTNTTFNDFASTLIQNGGAPFNNGPYKPQQPLSTLNGRPSAGVYTLVIQDDAAGNTGSLVNWTLTLQKPVSASGLGEPAADIISTSFRIFTMDQTNPLSSNTWTAVGPAARGDSGRIGGLAMDPSDPSGNTVYVGGASGGIWKTTNFLAPGGPTYIPLTDFGPTFGINIGGIAVFGRNGDPSQSIVFAATGEGDTGSRGVGFLRSMDGGATWTLLDSTDNTLPFDAPGRDHLFAKNGGTTSFKVLVDPKLGPSGVIVYAAVSGGNGGVWRSDDSGMHWKLMRSGQVTDIVLDPNSGTGGPNGNLQILYAGFRGEGVFFSPNRGQVFNLMSGGVGNPLIVDTTRNNPVNVTNPVDTPNGGKGRIVLAKPELTGNLAQDLIYQGWLYAGVVKPDSHFDGLYLTKDFGQNWTKLHIPTLPPVSGGGVTTVRAVPTNDYNNIDYDIGGGPPGSGLPAQGNYDISLAIDPTNPNVVYLGGTADGQPTGFIRIDATLVKDPHQLVGFDPARPDTGALLVNSTGGVTLDDITKAPPAPFLNLIRDPDQPFVAGATIYVRNSNTFVNDGSGVRWTPFDIGVTDQHRIYTFKDPLTGHARIVTGDDQGVFTAVDDNGTFSQGIGTAPFASGSRNGNLQITQFYYGAAQPSNLAAQIAGSLFYGSAQDNGGPTSGSNVLETGSIVWGGPGGDAGGVATDQQGSGTLYQFWWPCCGGNRTDFFQVNGVGRTFGLLQQSNPGPTPDPQWPNTFGANFTVNPLRGDEQNGQVVISSAVGRVFLTETAGRFWFPIAEPGDLDSTIARVQAFGAPDPNGPSGGVNLDDFLYLGTDGGHIYVTQTAGGGSAGRQWTNLSAGLDGSSIQSIVTNPTRGSHEAYAVTSRGVYHIADSLAPGAIWTNITGNLFQLTHDIFSGRPAGTTQTETQAKVLTSAVADWRYVIPNDFANPPTANPSDPDLTHPMLYVAGEGGVYRSTDDGVTWALYPSQDPASLNTTPTPPGGGGGLANAHVSDLDLALGNIDPITGRAVERISVNGNPANDIVGPNLLVATTFGRGTFAIRLAPYIFPNSVQLDPLSDSGDPTPPGQVPVTNDVQPIFHGLGQQSAFGNVVTVNLIDETNPANPIVIGTGQTDELGRFTVQVNPGVYQTDGSSDGTKLIGVQAITSSGTSGNIATFSFILDRTSPQAPSTPALSLTLPAPNGSDLGISNTDNITSNNAPFFDIITAEPTTTVTLLRDGVAVATRVGPGPIQDPGPVADGTHVYRAEQTDPAGNTSLLSGSLTVVIDTTVPATPRAPVLLDDSGIPGDKITNVKSPRFTGTADVDAAGGLIQLVDPAGTIVGTATIAADGRYTVQPNSPAGPTNLTDGAYTFRVIAMDVAGNRSAPSPSITVTILSRTPAQPTLTLVPTDDSGVPGDGITNIRNPRLTGRATPGLTVELVAFADLRTLNNVTVTAGSVITTALVKTDGTFLVQFPYLLADQTVQVVARVRDVAGNINPSVPLVITIDGTPPTAGVVLSLSPADDTGTKGDNRTTSRRPHLIGTTSEPGLFVDLVRSDGLVLASAISGSDGKFSLQPPFNLSNGTIALQARVRDVAGNQGAPSNTVTLTIISVPNDFDGDGTSDLVTFRQGQWTILQSSGGLKVVNFGATTDIPLMGDFDGDGKADLAVFRPETATWYIMRSRDGAAVTQFGAANGDVAVPADFDGDGITDLAVYRPNTGQWFILQSSGGARVVSFGAANSDVPIPADFDGDGKADLAVYRPNEARWLVTFSSGTGVINTSFGAPNTDVPVPTDFDGDGKADLAVYRPSTSQWFVLKSAGGVIAQAVGGAKDIPAPLDYDGDGKADLATFRPASGQWFIQQSSTNTQRTEVLGLAIDAVPVAAPYDYRRLRAKSRWQI